MKVLKRTIAICMCVILTLTAAPLSGFVGLELPDWIDFNKLVFAKAVDTSLTVKQIDLGGYHSAAVTNDGDLYMWGDNSYGQIGDGSADDRLSPTKVMSNVSSVELGIYHSAAITTNGDLYVWGANGESVPTKIMSDVKNVFLPEFSLGDWRVAVITYDNDLYMWGDNTQGSLGDGTTVAKSAPVKILDNIKKVELGEYHTAAITQNNDLYLWGINEWCQLGDGTRTNRYKPIKVLSDISDVNLSVKNSAAITNSGKLYIWGENYYGQIGSNVHTVYTQSVPYSVLSDVKNVCLTDTAALAVTNSGELYGWGWARFETFGPNDNDYVPTKLTTDVTSFLADGWLLNGYIIDSTDNLLRFYELSVSEILKNVNYVCCGEQSQAALTNDNELYMWGDNSNGQLGNGTTTDSSTPIKVAFSDLSDDDTEEEYFTPSLNYGVDRFSFGESISGYKGENVNSLIVYTSADYDTTSLTIKSSNTDVVSIGIITHDSGDYICGDNEHRAKVQLNFKSKGTATITVTSPEGVSESITVTVSSNTVELTPEEQQYVNEHVNFVNSNNYSNLVTNASFYNQIWQYEEGSRNFTRYAVWDVIGDVGKVLSFDMPGLLQTENPYDIILIDVFRDYANRTQSGAVTSAEKYAKEFFAVPALYNDMLDVFKTSEAWSDDLAEPLESYIKNKQVDWVNGIFLTGDTFDMADYNPALYNTLSKVIKDLDSSKLSKLFGGLKNTGTIIDYIGTTGDVVYRFYDAYQKYTIAKAIFESNAEVLSALQVIADNMLTGNASTLLNDALEPYWTAFNCDNTYTAVCNFLIENGFAGSSGAVAYNYLCRGIVQEMAYFALNAVTGISFGALSATYNLTYLCLDHLSSLGKQSETHDLMNAAALLEKHLVVLVKNNGGKLIGEQTLKNAKCFDSTWGLLQSLESYCYKTMATYASAFKKEYKFNYNIHTTLINNVFFKLIAKQQLNEDISSCDAAIQTVVYLESEWKKYSCHKTNYSPSKMATVKCPTDVYVYDSQGNLVLSIVNNKITLCEDGITAFVDGDEKIIVLPTTQKYSIKVTATDNGTMDYSIKCFDMLELVGVVGYNDVELTDGKSYNGNIPTDISANADEYNLISDSGITKTPTTEIDESSIFNPEKTISELSVSQSPDKTTYVIKNELDITGLEIKIRYSDGTTKTVNSGFTCSPTTLNTAGTQKITVTYGGKTTYFNVNVTDTSGVSLTINSSNSAVISTGGTKKNYIFKPNESGTYVIYSTGSSDTKVYLYNSSGTQLTSDDDGGADRNFRLEYNLTAGNTYKFAVGYYNSSATGTVAFKFGKVYTVTYNANSGSGAPSSQKKDYGAALTLSTTKPTRTGYTFTGWNTKADGTGTSYAAGASYTANAAVTLYAQWKANTYTVKYNANSGTGTMSNSSHTYDVSKALTANAFTKDGYTFVGWSTSSSATTATYTDGQSVKNLTSTNGGTVTLYAVWKKNDESLSVNSSNSAVISTGGAKKNYIFTPSESGTYVIYSTGSSDTKVYLYNSSGTELANNDDSGEGSNFRLQYNLTAGNTYKFSVGYYNSSRTGTIAFKFGKVYTVTYNANGGSGAPPSQTKDYGTALTLSSTTPQRTGYIFLGWSKNSSATSVSYWPGDSITISENTTLYAVWEKNDDESLSVNSSNTAVIPTGDTKRNYIFTPSESGTYVIYSTGSSDTKVYLYNSSGTELANNDDGGADNNFRLQYNLTAGNTYRFAVGYYSSSSTGTIAFKFGKVYTVTYNANGGSSAPSSQTKDYGTDLTLSSATPKRTGYVFLGWSESSNATSATYLAGETYTSERDVTLYAVWKEIYTLSYDVNGGSGAPSSQTGSTSYTISSTKPERNGYVFLGWSKDRSATSAVYQPGDEIIISGNTTLYAVWNESLSANSSNTARISTAGTKKYYIFTPSKSGTYVIYSTGSMDTIVYLYDSSGVQLAYDDNGGTDGNFRFEYNFTAGNTYHFAVGYNDLSTTGAIAFKFGEVYTVTYYANGGSGEPSSQKKDYGTDLTLSSMIPQRTGYVFCGWLERRFDGLGDTYLAGETYTSESDVTLDADWEKAKLLSVNSLNYATISTHTRVEYYIFTPSESGAYVIYSTDSSNPKVSLYDSSNTQLAYDHNGATNANFRLEYNLIAGNTYHFTVTYFDWTKTGTIKFNFGKVYTVTYDANGGSNAPLSQTKDYGKTLKLSSVIPERTGYTFLGWSESSNATSATYSAGETYTSERDVTLYAVWKKLTYTLTYDANGGSGGPSSQAGSANYTISGAKPKRNDYIFLGWSTNRNATSASYYPDDRITLSGHTTLYAVWQYNGTISIRNNSGSRTINYGETLRLAAIIDDMPSDAKIYWFVDGVYKGEGETFDLTFESGTKTVEVKLVDSKGNVLKNTSGIEITDSEKVTVKAGFFQKLANFFKSLFGISRIILQSIYY